MTGKAMCANATRVLTAKSRNVFLHRVTHVNIKNYPENWNAIFRPLFRIGIMQVDKGIISLYMVYTF